MLKTSALAIAVAVGFGGAAMAQTVRPPILPDPAGPVLVKHDKDEHGRGRKLGHYKHRDRDEEDSYESLGSVEWGVGPRIHEEARRGDREQEGRGGDRSADVGGRGGGRDDRRRLAARDGPSPFSRHPAN